MPAVNEITSDRLRELAGARDAYGKVLSLYVNLDPAEFGTRPARAVEVNAVLDEAGRALRDEPRLGHDEREALKADLDRVRDHLTGTLDADGAQGLAIFAGGGGAKLEVLKLPEPVQHHVVIGDGPYLEPLARIGARERWWVLVVDRRRARLLEGGAEGLTEIWSTLDQEPFAHRQPRDDKAPAKEAGDHLKLVAEELRRRVDHVGHIDGLLLGGGPGTVSELSERLHGDVARCVVGRFDVDVGAPAPVIHAAVAPLLAEQRRHRDDRLVERLEEGLARGTRAASGLADVLPALHERRVEALLVLQGFSAAGHECPRCGRLSVDIGGACPVDGAATHPVGDVVEAAIELAWAQDATVRVLDGHGLERHGGLAAILRF